ncbi:hypothetical protein AB0B25_18630 [Nocardia sp. NPDC049190]|uniref:hypothetical protein n=1 Tax=Nocardia sp. NPDC049190 TaxID=3155650 RepID=UPI0033DB7E10
MAAKICIARPRPADVRCDVVESLVDGYEVTSSFDEERPGIGHSGQRQKVAGGGVISLIP